MERGFVPEVEQQLLGAILLGGEHRGVFALLDESHFLEPVHQVIYSAAKVAFERYSSTSLPAVLRIVPEDAKTAFKAATGTELAAYLQRLADSTTFGAGSMGAAARNVLDQWARIYLAQETVAIGEAARAPDADVRKLVHELGAAIDLVGSQVRRAGRGKTRVHAADALEAALVEAEAARERGGLTGITTGLADLDRLTGGLQRRDLILLGARPSMGKTTVGGCIAVSAASKGFGVGIFSLEMDNAKLGVRLGSDLAARKGVRIPYENVLNTSATPDDIALVRQCEDDLRKLPLWMDDAAGITITELRAKFEAMVQDADEAGFALDLVIVDHLLKIAASSRYAGQRVNEIAEITGALKELAREYDIAMLVLTQLNRALEQRDDKRPTLADLRDSGAIEQDADAVLFLYREHYYLSRQKADDADKQIDLEARALACANLAEIEIAKQRNGRTQRIDIYVDMPCSHIGNAARAGYGYGAAA